MTMRRIVKTAVFWVSTAAIAPMIASYRLRSLVIGPDRALQGSTQALAFVPGLLGQYLRRAFLARALASCDRSVTVEFGTVFSRADARIDADVYIGPACHIGLVHIERDVLIAAGVHVPSGGETHGSADLSAPIREQPGRLRRVRIGAGAWIGSGSIVLADVGAGAIVGAGSVVPRPVPDLVIAAGVPAKVIRHRGADRRSA
jgi:acetyltransferase-like isoleucine patch superfamily enzyme